jgi:lipoic acid synthetase
MEALLFDRNCKGYSQNESKYNSRDLIPDFQGIERNIDRIIDATEVVSHNMETVRRLTREVRIQAKYDRSLEVLRYLKEKGINRTKSGIMLD